MYPLMSSYETLALQHFNLDRIRDGIREDFLRREVTQAIGRFSYVNTLTNRRSTTPPFAHPIIDIKSDYADITIDARPCVSEVSAGGELKVRDVREYHFRVLRAALELAWQSPDHRETLRTCSDLPMDVYCRNISETLTQRLGLDPEHQAKIAALAGFFYLKCFEDSSDEKLYQKNLAIVSRVTRIPANRIIDWFPEPVDMSSLDGFCFAVQEHLNTPRTKALNPAFMFAIFGSGWFTQNGNEVMCAALEFPPLWIACCFYGVDERAMRNSRIGKLLERMRRGDQDALFKRAVLSIIS